MSEHQENAQTDNQVSLPSENVSAPKPQNAKERFYEKLPFSYRQVDIFVKVMIALIAVVLLVGVLASTRS